MNKQEINKQDMYKNTLIAINILKRKGIGIQEAISLIRANPFILQIDYHELEKRLYLIINHSNIYAALYVEDNTYSWSLWKDNTFTPFVTSTANEKNNDYIIEMMINSIEKYFKIRQEQKDTLEEKIEQFNLIKKNEDGYHLK